MERALATVRTIGKVTPIEGTEKLAIAQVDGWQCVVDKNEIKEGQKVVYFEIDSALPVDDARYAFLKDRCYKCWKGSKGDLYDECLRIRTIKLRGNISQGLILSLSAFPQITQNVHDVTELLHVRHYDDVRESAEAKQGKVRLAGDAKGNFPDYLCPRTDEERLQNLPDYFESMKEVFFECTEKNDGSSMSVMYAPSKRPEDPFFVCSRRLELKRNEENAFWKAAIDFRLEEKLKELYEKNNKWELALQGELVGPGLNGNRDGYENTEFHVFRIFDIGRQQWLHPLRRQTLCSAMCIQHVPVIKQDWRVFQDFHTMEDFLQFVKGKTAKGHEREGMVWKSDDGKVSFKVINNDYLLKEK